MGPVAARRIAVETQRAGTALHIAGGGSVGDQAVHGNVAVGKRQVDAGGIAMAGQETATPQIDATLEAAHPAAGARIGKRLVAIVDPLPEEARPVGAGDAGALAAGVRKRQRVTDAFVQCAERLQAHLPRDRLHHAIGGKLRPDDRKDAWRQHGSGGGEGPIGSTGPGPGTMKAERRNQSLGGCR